MRGLRDGTTVALVRDIRRSFVLNKSALFVVALVLVALSGRCDAQAQTVTRKSEVGFHYTSIKLSAFDSREDGGGVRLAYNINDYLAVEAEGNIFEFSIGDHPTDDVLAAQGLLGVKAGLRNRRVGVFAKVRPGVTNFPTLRVNRRFCSILLPCEGGSRSGNRFALDAGAVVELYPTERIIVRLDIGDTMIRFRDDSFSGSTTRVRIKDGFSHNFQLGVGIGFRF
jgi:hypothetical protein